MWQPEAAGCSRVCWRHVMNVGKAAGSWAPQVLLRNIPATGGPGFPLHKYTGGAPAEEAVAPDLRRRAGAHPLPRTLRHHGHRAGLPAGEPCAEVPPGGVHGFAGLEQGWMPCRLRRLQPQLTPAQNPDCCAGPGLTRLAKCVPPVQCSGSPPCATFTSPPPCPPRPHSHIPFPTQIDESVFFLVEFGPRCQHIRMRHCEVLQGSYIGIQDLKVRGRLPECWAALREQGVMLRVEAGYREPSGKLGLPKEREPCGGPGNCQVAYGFPPLMMRAQHANPPRALAGAGRSHAPVPGALPAARGHLPHGGPPGDDRLRGQVHGGQPVDTPRDHAHHAQASRRRTPAQTRPRCKLGTPSKAWEPWVRGPRLQGR